MYNRHTAFYYTHEDDTRHHFYENPALHSDHTDITLDEDLDHHNTNTTTHRRRTLDWRRDSSGRPTTDRRPRRCPRRPPRQTQPRHQRQETTPPP
ncbi:hypothetical protein Pcinc_043208 [Petrolisthes cinctipes]|nr:hypothetical protein Pcinc_043208 [Petrolisthes cinctipes]